MYIGRIGPITMVLIFVRKYNAKKGKDVNYIKETYLNRIMRWKTICCIRAWNFWLYTCKDTFSIW